MVAVLFARSDSVYKSLPGCDVWDAERDARKWPGGVSVVAHPPCRAWGRLRQFAKPRTDEKALALFAVEQVRRYGGVLEHPASSSLWAAAELPRPGEFCDEFGGWTLEVDQFRFGHKAEKLTWLYIVGAGVASIPPIPSRVGNPAYCIRPPKKGLRLPTVSKVEREATPPLFAHWLVDLAFRCAVRFPADHLVDAS